MIAAEESGLLFACILDEKGGAKPIDWSMVQSWSPKDGPIWIHLDRADPAAVQWLRDQSGLTSVTIDAITAEETRPRVFRGKNGYIAILRGVNTSEADEPADLVSLRIWCDGNRLITLRHRRLFVPSQIYQELTDDEAGPSTLPSLFEEVIARLVMQMTGVVSVIDQRLDTIELDAESAETSEIRRELAEIRKDAVELRRFMAPQREALSAMMADPPKWLPDELRPAMRETMDRQQRLVEELDALRERAHVIKDDVTNRLTETMNRNMYVISVMAAIFLPLSFFTGLLGINVGGMPGVENSWAFAITCALMIALLVVEVWLFRRLRWM